MILYIKDIYLNTSMSYFTCFCPDTIAPSPYTFKHAFINEAFGLQIDLII
jgi:hypothetical protein